MKGFIEKNAQVLVFLGGLVAVTVSTTWFLSHQIHSVRTDMHEMEVRLNNKIHVVDDRLGNMINALDRRLTVVETVLILQGYPIKNLALNDEMAATQSSSRMP